MQVLQKQQHLKTVTEVLVLGYVQQPAIADAKEDVVTHVLEVARDSVAAIALAVVVRIVQKDVVVDVQRAVLANVV